MNYTQIWALLDSIQAHIRAFDVKAQIAITVNGILAGVIATEIVKASEYGGAGMHWRFLCVCLTAGMGLCASILAICLAIYVVHPQINLNQPSSHFFFWHIAARYEDDYALAAQEMKNLSEDAIVEDLATQVLANSIVCKLKAQRGKGAITLTGVALILYVASVPWFASMVYSAASLAPVR